MEADFFSKSHNYALGLRYGLGYVMYNIYFSDEIVPLEEFAHRFELYLLFNLTDKWFIKVPLSVYDTKDLNFYIISLGMGLRF